MTSISDLSKAFLRISTASLLAYFASSTSGLAENTGGLSEAERDFLRSKFQQQLLESELAVGRDPRSIRAYSDRGDAALFLGNFPQAIADFEKMIALDPSEDPKHWRLGIAYYFVGSFTKSARQFEKYHAYDGRDRENGIWKFLAQVPVDGVERARAEMLTYPRFDREPFPLLYAMFAGQKTPDDVFADLERRGLKKDPEILFFANYYCALEEQRLGHPARAEELLAAAVANPVGHSTRGGAGYMWQVARLHWERLQAARHLPQRPRFTPPPPQTPPPQTPPQN